MSDIDLTLYSTRISSKDVKKMKILTGSVNIRKTELQINLAQVGLQGAFILDSKNALITYLRFNLSCAFQKDGFSI